MLLFTPAAFDTQQAKQRFSSTRVGRFFAGDSRSLEENAPEESTTSSSTTSTSSSSSSSTGSVEENQSRAASDPTRELPEESAVRTTDRSGLGVGVIAAIGAALLGAWALLGGDD